MTYPETDGKFAKQSGTNHNFLFRHVNKFSVSKSFIYIDPMSRFYLDSNV